ncbi:MAG: mRNA surveillance protein pelota [Candidatus Micrarchaeota archaeon]|nr:mRNA surveillance protein pelota [Candidatus Micrarchaeota archaeon]
MQILKQDKTQNLITLLAQNVEDLWYISTIIEKGDRVEAISFRTYQATEESDKEKKKVQIVLEVEKVEFSKFSSHLRISGKILDGKPLEYLQLGSYHTIDLEPGYWIKIIKDWKDYHIERIKQAIEQSKRPKLFILVIDEKKALFAKILGFGIEYSWEIEFKISKRLDSKTYVKEKQKIYQEIEERIEQQIKEENFSLLVAGPGFEAKNFFEYIKEKNKKLSSKIILEHCSYAERSGVVELLKKGIINKVIQQQQVAFELQQIEEFKALLAKGSNKITYGYENIKKATENNLVLKVLLLDKLVYETKIKELLEQLQNMKTKVYIFSSESEGGKELEAFGGMVCFLKSPIY